MSDTPAADATAAKGGLTVAATEGRECGEPAVDLDRMCSLALGVLDGEGIVGGHLDLHLVDEVDMAALNAQHMGSVGPTDVLSFPLDADDDPLFDAKDERLLGDLVLCPSVAAAQASSHVGSFDGEVALLVIHGVLHILGHDHLDEHEAVAMRLKEAHYLEPLGFVHPGAA